LEFIYEKNLFPELEYIFKHALTQEMAYNSLLQKRRKEIHENTGKAIEEIYAERLEEFYEMLAYHFDHGEVWGKAVEYLVKAGLKARHAFSIQAAMDHLGRAKEILEKHEPEVPWRTRYDLSYERGGALLDLGQAKYAVGELQAAADVARSQGETHLRVQALFTRVTAAIYSHDLGMMKEILEEMEPLAADNPDRLLGVTTHQAFCFYLLEDMPMTLAKEKEMNDLIRRAPNSPFAGMGGMFAGLFHRWRGDHKKSAEIFERALPILKASAEPIGYLTACMLYGLSMGEQGRYQEAVRVLEEGREFGLQSGERYTTPKVINSLGWAYHELCLFNQAIETNTQALNSIQALLGPDTPNQFEIESQTRVNLGENNLSIGDMEKAREHLELVYENAKNPEYFHNRLRWKVRCLVALGELWLEAGDPDKADFFLAELVEQQWTDKFPFKKYQVRAGRLRGRILSARSEVETAETELNRAISLAAQIGNPTQLWKTRQALGELILKQGKSDEARAEFQAALQIVRGIAEGLTDAALKEGYLKSEPIKILFSQAEES
jgi:tetratricopeptide (TPR) repeat protein